ncbi:MAG: D-alanyl-D-alanine carboxypeptidase/D-alanyl-D-alanine endopeptidase [Janibacter sp.]
MRHRPWSATAVGLLAATVAVTSSASAAAQPVPDPERVPEKVTGVPEPAQGVPAAPPSADRSAAVPDATLAARLQSRSEALVPSLGGRVVDVDSGESVWSRGGPVGLRPASSTRVLTALSAVQVLGADYRFRTRVLQPKTHDDRVYLEGRGDPTMSTARLKSLATSTANRLDAQGVKDIYLRVDDSFFPAPTSAHGWEAGDVPEYVAPVRALVVDQKNSMDTSMQAAKVYADALRARGIGIRSTTRMKAPATARQVTYRTSPVLRTVIADMLRVSQNDYAEALAWTTALEAGGSRTWEAVNWRTRREVARYGITTSGMKLYDGSGLSRANRISATTLSSLMAKLYTDRQMKPIVFRDDALPIAGRTGTLENRFGTPPSSCAVGRVRAKTGSLRDTTVLTGIATGTDGRTRAFAFLSGDRDNTAAVRQRIDELAATTVTCM